MDPDCEIYQGFVGDLVVEVAPGFRINIVGHSSGPFQVRLGPLLKASQTLSEKTFHLI
jgi:hypothetical protein